MIDVRGLLTTASACLLLAACSDGAPGAADKGAPAQMAQETPAPARPLAPNGPNDRLVMAFGDSLYAGYGLDRADGFSPELDVALDAALASRGLTATVHNAGVSGDTTAAGLGRLGFALDGLPKKPDLVLVGLGGNDMLRGISADQTRANLDAILTELDRRGIPAMLTGMMAAPNMGADYAAAFNPIYPDLARKHGVPLYPFFLDGVIGNPNLMQADSIHPNAAGVDIIIAKLAPVVADALTP